MKSRADDVFVDESERYRLRLHCEDCVFFDEAHDACANGFPTAPHRKARESAEFFEFCKAFELA